MNDCWRWRGKGNQDGYGRLRIDGGKKIMAHRLSYILFNGKIPKGKLVLHKCDNPWCINPTHLFLGTDQDNQDDMINKGRKCQGESYPTSLLNDDAVRYIRKSGIPKHPEFGWTALAKKFNVSTSTIRAAASGRQWRHVK